VLEVISIGINYKNNEKWWGKLPKQLHVDNKSSSKATLEFWIYVGWFSDLHTEDFTDDLHDLLTGPFDDPELQPC
jgi:hypothetical protein